MNTYLKHNSCSIKLHSEKSLFTKSYLFILIFLAANLFGLFDLHGVMIANLVEIHLSVEDGEMHQAVISNVSFNGEAVDLSQKNFMHRKINKIIYTAQGQYPIEWTTEKSEKPWGGMIETKKHRRLIVIELTDAVVYLNIRGENLTIY